MADMTNESGLREKIKDVLLDYCRQYADVRSCMVGSARASNTAMLLSDGADRLLALISPAGEVSVPVVPTEAMQNMGVNAASDEFGWADEGQIKNIWKAMLSAAPRGMEG